MKKQSATILPVVTVFVILFTIIGYPEGDAWAQSDECCDEPGQIDQCWYEDAINDGIACDEDTDCPSGACDTDVGRCICADDEDCRDGICNSSWRCGPSWCNGFMTCSCWGGCTWWDENTSLTPNDIADANGLFCCESLYPEEPSETMPLIAGFYSQTPCASDQCDEDSDCDDGNMCTDDTCNLATSSCEYAFNTGPCNDDFFFCNGPEVCDGAGNCVHSGDPCAAGGQCADTCNETDDNCFNPLGESCSDGDPCTEPDACDGAGNCAGGPPIDCDDGNICTTDLCQDDGSGNPTCVYVNADGTSCDADGDPCTDNDQCLGGVCVPGAPYDCSGISTQCSNGVCQDDGTGTAECIDDYLPNGTPCNDGLFCTFTDTCDGSGNCTGAVDPCAGGGVCNNICNEVADNCFSPNGTPCDADSSNCTPDDFCDGAGACIADTGNAVDCTALSDQCNNFVCDAVTGNCDYDNAALIGAQCNLDDNGCTLETCQGAGPDQQLTCTPLSTSVCDDGNVCTDDDCTSTGINSYTCDNPPLPDTTSCNADSNGCTQDDHCDGAGGCAVGTAVTPADCATQLGVDTDCNTGLCVSAGDNSYTCTADLLVTSPGDCNADNDGCTLDTCQNSGNPLVGAVCTVGSAYDCSALDNPPCQYGYCDDFGDFYNYSCQSGDAADTVACNFDSNGCTVDDHCDGAGSCTAGDPAVCTPSDACQNAVCQSTGDNTFTCPETPIANCCLVDGDCAALVCPGSADPPVGCSRAACVGNSCMCQNEAVGTACTDYSEVDFPQNCYDGLCDASGVCVPTQHPAYNNMCSDAFQAGDPTQIDTTGDWYMGAIPNTAPSGTTLSITGSTTCAYNNYAAAGDNCIEDSSSTDLGEDGRDLVYVFEYQSNAVDEYDLYAYVIKLEANYDIGVYVKTDIVTANDCPEGNDPTADDPDAGGFQGSVLSNTCVFPYNDGSTPNPPPAVIEDECEGGVNLLFDQECCDPCTHPQGFTCGYWWCERGYPDGCDMCTPGDCDGIWSYPEPAVECSSTVSGPGWDDYDYLASAIISAQGAGDSSWKRVFIFVDGVAAESGDFKVTVEKREWSAGPCDRVDDDTRIFDVTHPEPGGSVYMGTFENTVNSMHAGGGSCGGYNCNGAFSGRTSCHGSGSANPFWPNDVNFKIHRSAAEGDGNYCIITNESITGGADLVVDMIRRWDSNAFTICDESYSGMWCERNNFGNSIKEEFTAGAGELYLLSISEYGFRDEPCDPNAGDDCYFELTVYEGACPLVCLPPNDTVLGTVNVNDPAWNQVIFTDRITTSDGDDYWLKSGDDEDHVYELYNNTGQTIEVTFEVCGDYDAVLGLMDCEQNRLESEDDVGDGGCERFDYDVPASTDPYYIIVDTDGNPALDDYTLTVSWGTPPASCVDWSTYFPVLTGTVTIDGTGFSISNLTGTTTDSTYNYDPSSGNSWNGRDELWEVVVTADSRVRFSGCNNGGGGNYDGMAALRDCEWSLVANNDDGCGGGGMPRFTADLEAGLSPYYFIVDGYRSSGNGNYNFGLSYQ